MCRPYLAAVRRADLRIGDAPQQFAAFVGCIALQLLDSGGQRRTPSGCSGNGHAIHAVLVKLHRRLQCVCRSGDDHYAQPCVLVAPRNTVPAGKAPAATSTVRRTATAPVQIGHRPVSGHARDRVLPAPTIAHPLGA
jgi:hypothetical protein